MGTVVNKFSRLPHLKSAVLRRIMATLACHYFGDEVVFDFGGMACKPQRISHRVNELWGILYTEKERQFMYVCTYFLGNT